MTYTTLFLKLLQVDFNKGHMSEALGMNDLFFKHDK